MVTLSNKFDKKTNCCDIKIHQVCDGQEAISIAYENVIDIALIDINMPKVNGIEVIANLSKKYPSAILIVISAHSKVEKQHEALVTQIQNQYLLSFSTSV